MPIEIVVFDKQHYLAARDLWERTEGVGLSEADERGAIEAFLERNLGLSFAAMDGERLVGTILVGHDGRRGLIHHLAAAESARRRGIGARLVRAGLEALAGSGIRKCHLLVFAHNAAGRLFWQAIGAEHRETLAIYSLSTAPAP